MLQDFKRQGKRISVVEEKILDARLFGLSVCQMEDDELEEIIPRFLFKVAALTGIKLPDNEIYMHELESEIKIYLLDSPIKNLTEEEIITAIRINTPSIFLVHRLPTGIDINRIEPFGGIVSLEFLAKVLNNYMIVRNCLDRKLENEINGVGFNY